MPQTRQLPFAPNLPRGTPHKPFVVSLSNHAMHLRIVVHPHRRSVPRASRRTPPLPFVVSLSNHNISTPGPRAGHRGPLPFAPNPSRRTPPLPFVVSLSNHITSTPGLHPAHP